jgi:putative oxidoreductase
MYNKATHNFGRILIASLFIATSIYGFVYNFDNYVNMVASKNIPLPHIVAYCVLIFKLVAGMLLLFNSCTKLVVTSLIVFIVAVTVIYNNPIDDETQFLDMMKNIGLVGGLLLLY